MMVTTFVVVDIRAVVLMLVERSLRQREAHIVFQHGGSARCSLRRDWHRSLLVRASRYKIETITLSIPRIVTLAVPAPVAEVVSIIIDQCTFISLLPSPQERLRAAHVTGRLKTSLVNAGAERVLLVPMIDEVLLAVDARVRASAIMLVEPRHGTRSSLAACYRNGWGSASWAGHGRAD